ncbi:DUF973 family protein [Sulfolobus tengchongensis]|uniref:DUF973 family protein n=1 Tax=Sulfolobus tengchongensis TaxID=207809 RepID=A0AAX4L2B6_9CREN
MANKVFQKLLLPNENLIDYIPHRALNNFYIGLTNFRVLVIDNRQKREKITEIPLNSITKISTNYQSKRPIAVGVGFIVLGAILLRVYIGIFFIIVGILALLGKQKTGELIINTDSKTFTFKILRIEKKELDEFETRIREILEGKITLPSPPPIDSPQFDVQPPPNTAEPIVNTTGSAIIKSNGDVIANIQVTTPTILLTAKIDGTNYYSVLIMPQSIPAGSTEVKIKLSPLPIQLNPDKIYSLTLTAESNGNKFDIRIPARFQY